MGRPKQNEISIRRQIIINNESVNTQLEKEYKKYKNRSLIINKRLLHSYLITPKFTDL